MVVGKTRVEHNKEKAVRKKKHQLIIVGENPKTIHEYHEAFLGMPRFGEGQPQLLGLDDKKQVEFWNSQTISPSQRKFLLDNGKQTPRYSDLRSGNTRSSIETSEEKAERKRCASEKQRETNDKNGNYAPENIKESMGIKAFITECENHDLPFVFKPVFDGLGVDLLVQHKDALDKGKWKCIQFKTGTHNKEGRGVNLNTSKNDLGSGGIYEQMCLIGLILEYDADTFRECPTFDHISLSTIKEMFVFSTKSNMPGKALYPMAWAPSSRPDKFGSSRYVAERDGYLRLSNILDRFSKIVSDLPEFTLDQVYFETGPCTPNVQINPLKKNEMMQIQVLSQLLSKDGIEVVAPLRQNETTDVILRSDDWQRTVSLKTAHENGGPDNFYCKKSKHPFHKYCDLVIAFVHDDNDEFSIPIKCYVFDAYHFYVTNIRKDFCWNALKYVDNLFTVDSPEFLARTLALM